MSVEARARIFKRCDAKDGASCRSRNYKPRVIISSDSKNWKTPGAENKHKASVLWPKMINIEESSISRSSGSYSNRPEIIENYEKLVPWVMSNGGAVTLTGECHLVYMTVIDLTGVIQIWLDNIKERYCDKNTRTFQALAAPATDIFQRFSEVQKEMHIAITSRRI